MLQQGGQPRLANQGIKEQITRVFMQASHGNVTITMAIEDLENTFHSTCRNQFSLTVALLKRTKLAVEWRFCCRIDLLKRILKQLVQRLGSVSQFFRHQ